MAFAIRPPTPSPPLMAKFPDIFSPHFFSFATATFARLVLTVVGPKRLATSQMVDDQQNVDLVLFPLMG